MATVNVACKLPHGLIIELPGHPAVELAGANSRSAVAGFGMTKVDKEFFDRWAKAYADFPPVKRGLIFAQEREESARKEAAEKEKEKSGFEGIDPERPAPGIKAENYEGKSK
ncbi:hypothetical protein [Bordetella sp. 02P26C-1]|uniref:hypothetical protein n=1 Tax=Bordetella sp. 02P26C-1 TaxID=2683195 RepID=UPI0013561C8F|nr:hypothetical protein [Bordetella sp. 02P26C-1]MVW80182.1 hypothetical protein [Bordetella sp. 02P26C-1]